MKYFILFTFLIFNLYVNACDCVNIHGLEEAKVAFKGKILKIARVDSDYVRYEVTFKLIKRIKGIKKKVKTIVIDIPCLYDACCGVPFKEDEVYEVKAYESGRRMKTNLCWAPTKINS